MTVVGEDKTVTYDDLSDSERIRVYDAGVDPAEVDQPAAHAILAAKLCVLDEANLRRAVATAPYRDRLPPACVPLAVHPLANPVYHLAIVRVGERARIPTRPTTAGIGWGVHYPIPCHFQPGYAEFADLLPVAEHATHEILSLPMHPTLTKTHVERLCEVLRGICS